MIQKMPNTTKEQMTEIDIILSIITLCISSPSSTVERHRQTEVIIKEKSKDSIKVMGGKTFQKHGTRKQKSVSMRYFDKEKFKTKINQMNATSYSSK